MNPLEGRQLEDVLSNLSDADIKRIKRLSASKVQLWENCHLAFFQRYIAHEKVPENIRLTFGKSIHYFLDQFYKKNYKSPDSFANSWSWYWWRKISGEGVRDKKTLENLEIKEYPTFRNVPMEPYAPTDEEGVMKIGNHISYGNFIDDDLTFIGKGKGKEDVHPKVNISWGYSSLGRSILKRFHERHKGKEPPAHREERKTLDLFGHETIVILDRVDLWPNGDWTITDYKTNKFPPRPNEIHRNVQFTIYSKAAREIYGKEFGSDEAAIFQYHLRTGEFFETHRSERDFIHLEQLLDRVSREIEDALTTGNFAPHYDYRCSSCEFVIPCETYSQGYGGPKIVRGGRLKEPKSFGGWEDLEEKYSPGMEAID
jgi:RecB family exonuclease